MTVKKYDFAIVGGGPGGYVAAIRAAQSGKSVALIESQQVGGTCLNRGCIPSKAHIANSEMFRKVKTASQYGVLTNEVSLDYSKMKQRVDHTVSGILKGLTALIKANQITVFKGKGTFLSPHQVKVTGKESCIIEAQTLVIATGSEPKNISSFPFDSERILSSTSLLEKNELPKSLVVIGGGVIGCEFASWYDAFGVEVTILEALPHILPMEDEALSGGLRTLFEKRGIKIETGVKVEKIQPTKQGVKVSLSEGTSVEAQWALVAVGRELNTTGIGLERTGVGKTPQGAIEVNEHMQTATPHIYAIGDITAKHMLAHVASHQGIVAVEHALGNENSVMHYHAIPSVVFTYPEVASVGLTLKQALAQGFHAKIGSFPFQALGKSKAKGEAEGFSQIVFDTQTRQLLGAQVMGPEAASLISEMGVAIQNELTLDCLKETVHAHPTFPEAWFEAAYLADGHPLHYPPKKNRMLAGHAS